MQTTTMRDQARDILSDIIAHTGLDVLEVIASPNEWGGFDVEGTGLDGFNGVRVAFEDTDVVVFPFAPDGYPTGATARFDGVPSGVVALTVAAYLA